MKVVIAGGGKIGLNLARAMLEQRKNVSLIERDKIKCAHLADALDAQIICGDCSMVSVLEAAGTQDADCFMAVTGSDQDNLVSAQLAKNYFHAQKSIVRTSDPRNLETFRLLGIDFAVSSTEIIAKLIEQEADLAHMHLLATLGKGKAGICTMVLPENTAYHGMQVKDLVFPKGALMISVVRGEELIIPNGSTVLERGDEVVAVCEENYQKALTKVLGEVAKT